MRWYVGLAGPNLSFRSSAVGLILRFEKISESNHSTTVTETFDTLIELISRRSSTNKTRSNWIQPTAPRLKEAEPKHSTEAKRRATKRASENSTKTLLLTKTTHKQTTTRSGTKRRKRGDSRSANTKKTKTHLPSMEKPKHHINL